jgi:hypothetical protein
MAKGLLSGGKSNKGKGKGKHKNKNKKKRVKGLKIEKGLSKKVDKALSKSGVIKPLEELRDSTNLRNKKGKVVTTPVTEFRAAGGDVQFVPHLEAILDVYDINSVVIHEKTLLPLLEDYNDFSSDINITLANVTLMATALQSTCKSKKEVKAIRSLYKHAEKSLKTLNKLYNKKVASKLEPAIEKQAPAAIKIKGNKKAELE